MGRMAWNGLSARQGSSAEAPLLSRFMPQRDLLVETMGVTV